MVEMSTEFLFSGRWKSNTKKFTSESSPGTEAWGIFIKDTPSARSSSLGSSRLATATAKRVIPEYGDSGNSETSLKNCLKMVGGTGSFGGWTQGCPWS